MAAIARPASSSGTQSGGEFFRYHGFRAPGVRLFRNLGFRAKAWVITASFVIPLALVGYHWFAAQAASIEFSAKEQLGVEYGQAAMGVLALAQQQRQLTLAAVAGHQDAAAIASVQARLDEALNALGALEARLGGELSTRSAFDAALAARRDVAAPEAGRERALQTHGAFAKAVMDLITAAADGSNLTLDPDIDTYYLMDAAYGALPGLTESVSNLGAMAAADAFGAARSEGAVKRAIATEALNATLLERLNGGLSKVQALHPDLAPALDSAPAGVSVRRLHELLDTTAPERQPVLGLVGDSANGLIALQRTTAAELDRLLGERVSRLETQRNVVGAVVALSLGVGAYLFYCFSIVMSGGLAHVQRHIDRIAEGDLTGEPIAWGRDEIGTVLDRLAGMRRQLAASIGTIRSSADEVATASAELSCGTVDLARRTEATAANLEKSASAMEQMQSTTRNTADTTREVAEVARDNAGMAQRGGTVIAQAVTTMQEIQDSSSKVADIIGVIDSIAFQTNILALNAAVEAARAGEQGKGFAVVAGEVRSLARRSAEAAREIKDLIASSVAKTESGAAVVQQAGDAMRQIVGSVERINALLAEVSAAATEQTEGIAHVNATVAEIDRSTQQNAALVEQTTAAARSMQQQAQSLASVAARFRIA